MSHEKPSPVEIEFFTSHLRDLTGGEPGSKEPRIKIKKHKNINIGLLYDPSSFSPEQKLVLQEKEPSGGTFRTIVMTQHTGHFILRPYMTPDKIEVEMQKHLDEALELHAPLPEEETSREPNMEEFAAGIGQLKEVIWEKARTTRPMLQDDRLDIFSGLSHLMDYDEDQADEIFTGFFYMHFVD